MIDPATGASLTHPPPGVDRPGWWARGRGSIAKGAMTRKVVDRGVRPAHA